MQAQGNAAAEVFQVVDPERPLWADEAAQGRGESVVGSQRFEQREAGIGVIELRPQHRFTVLVIRTGDGSLCI